MKNAFGGLLQGRTATSRTAHPRDAGRPPRDPEGDSHVVFAMMDGSTAGNGPARASCTRRRRTPSRLERPGGDRPVATKIMGFDPMAVDYIRPGTRKVSARRPARDRDRSANANDAAAENWNFKVGGTQVTASWAGWRGTGRRKCCRRRSCTRHSSRRRSCSAKRPARLLPLAVERKEDLRALAREESPGHLFAKYESEGAQAPSTAPVSRRSPNNDNLARSG